MLEVRGLHVSYGKVRAVQGVSLEVNEGEIVALIGANGAGKSSTMHAVCGIERPSAGEILFLGRHIARLPPHRIMRRGIVQVPEGRLIFGGLTIAQNLRLGAYNVSGRARAEAYINHVLEFFPMLQGRLDERGSALSGGQAQMLALARGLMARPKLLMLDEPSLGLAPIAAQEVFALISRLRDSGVTILLVEQNVRQALTIADRGYVLESGRIIMDGEADALAGHELLVSAYLGLKRGE
ncbi:MAG: ABC transporter ATP-binding protein [Rhodospirillales bacterium]|nr:ABC transporter ATP-binding protein [Rhodospirillales bacterium]MDE0380885.1 ABC transporter ATP-binding protein [Rhodospirillales bacterium]